MKGANLSSPSVAYRHLQKLEDMGYLQKNNYGEYTTKNKARVRGFMWIGSHIQPKMQVYSLVFIIILFFELVVFALHYSVENFMFKVFFVLLILVTVFALAVLTIEALLHHKRIKLMQTEQKKHTNSNTS